MMMIDVGHDRDEIWLMVVFSQSFLQDPFTSSQELLLTLKDAACIPVFRHMKRIFVAFPNLGGCPWKIYVPPF